MASQHQLDAMSERRVGIAAICLSKRYIVFDNGLVLKITRFLDDMRVQTFDPWDAAYLEFGDQLHGWGEARLADYDMISWEDH